MIRLHVPLPGPFVWVPARRRRPSGRHTMVLLITLAVLGAIVHVIIPVLLGIALLTSLAYFTHTLAERRRHAR